MGGGSWGNGGANPTRMSCWCLQKLGWIKPSVHTGTKTLTIPTLETDPKACYRLSTGTATGPEYFLIENRQTIGMDKFLPGSGLAVWHIDERQSSNTNPLSYMVGLVQADGLQQLENGNNRGDDGDLFPGSKSATEVSDSTTPNLRAHGGAATKIKISAITTVGNDIKAKVKV
jgi:immune inhibitor A